MAEYTINKLEKRIYTDTPIVGIDGQYNYGNVDSDEYIRILGTSENNIINNESDLYTYVIHKQDSNLSDNPNGLLWQTYGSKIQITYCDIEDNRYYTNQVDSAGGEYHNVKVAFYIFDSETAAGKKVEDVFNNGERDNSDGNKIRDAIGIGNDVLKSPHLIGYYNEGNHREKEALGDVIEEWKTGEYMGDVSVKDFPRFATPGNSAVFFGGNGLETTTQVFDTDIEKFHDQVIGKGKDGSIYIVVRTCGDEREHVRPWAGTNDELDRSYTVIKIPKIEPFGPVN